jgi:hypothetical protein
LILSDGHLRELALTGKDIDAAASLAAATPAGRPACATWRRGMRRSGRRTILK